MDNIKQNIRSISGLILCMSLSGLASSFELLSEGAMGSVSAVSANTAEEIVSVAGPSAAGLRVDEDYELLPFRVSVQVDDSDKDEVSMEQNYELTQEVDSWADSLRQRSEIVTSSDFEVGYVDELPESSFDESAFVVREEGFEKLIFEPESSRNDGEESTSYEIGRVDQVITQIEQDVDSIEYIVERRVDFVATIDAYISTDTPSIGSAYISNLVGVSNVRIATVRE